ncbi:MAG: RDD family protein [Burkholderiaceae bacterium]|jgi:uncharacterized RDD family membrane protein YckC|nr:RDD family protein [Burkholderiaceae bacterium]
MEPSSDSRSAQIAPRWRRLISRAVDLFALGASVFAVLFGASKLGLERYPVNDAFVLGVIVIYELFVPWLARGLSFGRFLTGVRLVSESTLQRPSFFNCLGRLAARTGLFAVFAVFVVYEVSLPALVLIVAIEGLVGALTKQRQTLGDFVGRTVVIRRERRVPRLICASTRTASPPVKLEHSVYE